VGKGKGKKGGKGACLDGLFDELLDAGVGGCVDGDGGGVAACEGDFVGDGGDGGLGGLGVRGEGGEFGEVGWGGGGFGGDDDLKMGG
jgi:hypothetical protein